MKIEYYNDDEEYKKDYLKNHYFAVLEILITSLKEEGIKIDNHALHEFNKELVGGDFSLKTSSSKEIEDFLVSLSDFWNKTIGIVFI